MAVETTTRTYVLSDHVTAEQSLFDPTLTRFQNLYFQSEMEAGPEFWELLERFETPAGAEGDQLLQEAIEAHILVPADEPHPTGPLLDELEDALDGFMRKNLKTDQAGLNKVVPPAEPGDLVGVGNNLRRKLELVCQVWIGYITLLRKKMEKTPQEERLKVPTLADGAEGAWLYDAPELFIVGMFDHLCLLVDDVLASVPEGLSPAYLKATLNRPPQKEHLHQQPCTPQTAMQRVRRVARQFPQGAKVLLLGDDDLLSIAFEHVGGFDVTVLELDDDLLGFLKKAAPSARLVKKDLSEGLGEEFEGRFDVVLTDPPYNRDGMRFFLRCARPALKESHNSRLYLNTCLSLVEDAEDIHNTADSLGLERMDFFPGFNKYPLPEHIRLWGMSFLESMNLPERLGGTILDQPFLWADLLEYQPKAAPDTRVHYRMDLIESIDTRFQQIRLYEKDDQLCLVHNDGIQIHSGDVQANHEVMVTLPLVLSAQAKKVLILGGGDGMAAREALKFSEVERVVVVDLDGELLSLTQKQPELSLLSGRAFEDSRVELVEADAFEWLSNQEEKFDLIVNDLDYLRTTQQDELPMDRLKSFLSEQLPHLSEGGVLSYYVPVDRDGARFFDCTEEELPERATRLLSEFFETVVRTPIHTPYVGEHLFLCGCAEAEPRRRRDWPQETVQADDRLLDLSLARSAGPAQTPERSHSWEVDFRQSAFEVLKSGDQKALFLHGLCAWVTPTHRAIHGLATGLAAGFTKNQGSVLVLGCSGGWEASAALEQGFDKVTVLESDPDLMAAVRHLGELPEVEVVSGAPLDWLAECGQQFDLIVIRAEFFLEFLPRLLTAASGCLKEGGVLSLFANATLAGDLRGQIQIDELPFWMRYRFSDESGSFRYFLGSAAKFSLHREVKEGPYLRNWLLKEMLKC